MPLMPQDFVAKWRWVSARERQIAKKLDAAVLSAHGWAEGLSDEEILEKLLKLNLERAGR